MVIACLGWGSLIWNPHDLPINGSWLHNDPYLPIEFARQSRDGRVTLVCVPGMPRVQSLWTLLASPDLNTVREALRKREGISSKNIDKHIGVWTKEQPPQHDSLQRIVDVWANALNLDAVIWTNLPAKFQGVDGRVPTVNEVVVYLSKLEGQERQEAERYVRMTPRQIRTPYRIHIEHTLHWLPYGEVR